MKFHGTWNGNCYALFFLCVSLTITQKKNKKMVIVIVKYDILLAAPFVCINLACSMCRNRNWAINQASFSLNRTHITFFAFYLIFIFIFIMFFSFSLLTQRTKLPRPSLYENKTNLNMHNMAAAAAILTTSPSLCLCSCVLNYPFGLQLCLGRTSWSPTSWIAVASSVCLSGHVSLSCCVALKIFNSFRK